MAPISRPAMAAALALSWASMLAHNLYELPLGPADPENAGPLVVAGGLALAYAARPESRFVAGTALAWGVLNLVVGGLVTVLPLPFLPFAPEQSITHYGAHVVYTLGQVPLVVLAARAFRAADRRSLTTDPAAPR
jgi:hypothetical protein